MLRFWLLPLVVLKGAGAAGLLLGLLGRAAPRDYGRGRARPVHHRSPHHLRACAFHNIAFPGAYFALAIASAALAIAARDGRPLRGTRIMAAQNLARTAAAVRRHRCALW